MTLRALVRRPSSRLADGLITHIERQPVDVDLARRQWDGYVAALTGTGWQTIEVPVAEDCPDSVFVEDSAVMFGDTAVIVRPGAPQRRGRPPTPRKPCGGWVTRWSRWPTAPSTAVTS